MRHVQREIDRLAQLQIDTINVVERAQYLPLFSRLGPYDRSLVDRAASRSPRRLFEYWGHAASLVDARLEPSLRWRMARYADEAPWGFEKNPGLAERCLAEITERGPLSARDIEHDEVRSRDNWGWNWSGVKVALEWLQSAGLTATVSRNRQFERVYDLRERVLPATADVATAPVEDQVRELVRRSARALGVGSVRCLADYFRLSQRRTRAAIDDLVERGELVPVEVDGWGPAWRWAAARRPRRVEGAALLSPFDSLVFERNRLLALFGSHYRIEIYVPAPKRVFGYYVYLFLLDETIAARVDLKADRAKGRLLVQSAWLEPENAVQGAIADPDRVATALAGELRLLTDWQGLVDVEVVNRGDLASALARAVTR